MKRKPRRSKEETQRLVDQTAMKIVDAFKDGSIPKALAPSFIQRKDDVPCRKWSWRNQLITAIVGHSDARTFKAWQTVGRNVKKGEKCFYILEPVKICREDKETGEKRWIMVGTKPSPRFGLNQTEGEPLPVDTEYQNWIENLPLMDVAEAWGIKVEGFNGRTGKAFGRYQKSLIGDNKAIALGVKNLATWAHEMVHAADDKAGNLKEKGQHWRSETVAELGGCILLECLGLEQDSDRGGCWEYVQHYASAAKIDTVKACMDCLDRAGKAVAMILDEAEKIGAKHQEHQEALAA